MGELEQKIRKSLDEGYTKREIINVLKKEGYSEGEIGRALAIMSD